MSLDDIFDDIDADKKEEPTKEEHEKINKSEEASTSTTTSKSTDTGASENVNEGQEQAQEKKEGTKQIEDSEVDQLFGGEEAKLDELDVEKLFTRRKRRKRRKINWVQVVEVVFIIWLLIMGTLTVYTSTLDAALTKQTTIATENLNNGLNYLGNSQFLVANKSFYLAYLNFTSAQKLADTLEFYTRINIAYQAYLLVNPDLVSGLAMRRTLVQSGVYIALSGIWVTTALFSYRNAITRVSHNDKSFTSALEYLNISYKGALLSENYLNKSKNYLVSPGSYTLSTDLATQLNITQRVNSIMMGLSYDLIIISNLTYYTVSFYHQLYSGMTALESGDFQQALTLATSAKLGALDLLSDLNATNLYYLKNHGIALAAALSYLILAAKSVEDGAKIQQIDPFVTLAMNNATYVDYELNLLVGE